MQALVERQMERGWLSSSGCGFAWLESQCQVQKAAARCLLGKDLSLLTFLWKQTVWLFSLFFTCVPRCMHPPTPFALDCCMHLYQCWVYFILFIYSVIPQKDIKYLSRPHTFELVMQHNQTLVKERTQYKMGEEWSSSFTVWSQCVTKASLSALFLKAATAALS